MTTAIALAAPSEQAAAAAHYVAARNGNAVDAALAAAMVAINTEPGVCALAGGGFVTLWHPGRAPLAYDGYVTVPGRGGSRGAADGHVDTVTMAYGGGIETLVGAGAVAVPGTLAAVHAAWQDGGALDWRDILAPAVAAARDGFALSSACHHYLEYAGESIYSRSPDSRAALYDGNRLRPAGSTIVVPHLADSLALIAERGPDAFYRGALAERIVAHIDAGNGSLTAADLATYRPSGARRWWRTSATGNWRRTRRRRSVARCWRLC